MAKENYNNNNGEHKVKKQRLQDLQTMRKKSKRLEQQVAMECSHQKPNGDLDVHWVDEGTNTVRCNICDDSFSMEIIDKKELQLAQQVIHNAIQQMRALATDDEQEVVENLGRIDYAVAQVPKQYGRLIEALGKGNRGKKKNKNNKNKNGGNNKSGRIAGYEDVFEAVGRRGKK